MSFLSLGGIYQAPKSSTHFKGYMYITRENVCLFLKLSQIYMCIYGGMFVCLYAFINR